MPKKFVSRKDRQKIDLDEIDKLLEKTKEPVVELSSDNFDELPISTKTLQGLKDSNFIEMTEIQKKSLPLALCKKDVLAAAKTGSGKTLAFLIPVIENLYLSKWGPQDGLGALIVSPTRELAVQIFRVLCKIGKHHSFSAGLVIGGKDVKVEKERISRMNILIGTPGRLLQHMDETANFDANNLQVLVLDEADRCMDMGFSTTINGILDFLPNERQTLLFSATQAKSVKDLSRLSLSEPEYVGVYEDAKFSTPANLTQYYMEIELPSKLDTLFSFIKTHLSSKVIIFMSSCKQVRFIYETFRRMQPGITLMHLHGKQKQSKRVEIFEKFSSTPEAALFCTDIAARGLDFPAVDWVIQLDCPEDIETYIHRVGRTARYESAGNSLLFLLPSEEPAMTQLFESNSIKVTKISPKKSQLRSTKSLLQSYCFKDPEIKYIGQKAFVSYMKSVYLQKNKKIFDVHQLPAEAFAESLGLPGTPQIKFIKKGIKGQDKKELEENDKVTPDVKEADKKPKTKVEKLFAKKNRTVLAEHYTKLIDHGDETDPEGQESGPEEDFMTIKRLNHELEEVTDNIALNPEEIANMSRRQIVNAKQKSLKNAPKNEKLLFDDDGEAHQLYELEDGAAFAGREDVKAMQQEYFEIEQHKLQQQDALDKSVAKDKKREKKLKQKSRTREAEDESGVQVTLGSGSEDDMDTNDSDIGSDIESIQSEDEEEEEDDDDDDKMIVDYTRNKRNTQSSDSKPKSKRAKVIEADQPTTVEDQEALALKLLGDL